jgi:G3E family GTPase
MTSSAPYSADTTDRARLPVTIVTGFLGSGKTTLLNHILAAKHGLRIAVIVNEIGAIGIDSELIVSADNGMMELSNGCICCSVNNDFVEAIFRGLERNQRVDYLVVETTGLADPLPIILTFLRSEFRDRVRLDAIVALVDGDNFSLDVCDSDAARQQLRYADIILLNKCDLGNQEGLDAVECKIRESRADARIIRTTRSAVPLPLVLDVGVFRPDQYRQTAHHGHNGHLTTDRFSSLSFAQDQPFAVDKLQCFLNELPKEVFRAKGILWLDESDKRYLFHLVGKRFTLDESPWPGPKQNKLVLIGRNLDAGRLWHQLEACLARPSDGPH